MNRADYYRLRHALRAAKHEDRKWKPDPHARNYWLLRRPDSASPLLQGLAARDRSAILACPGEVSVAPGPRSSWYRNWRPESGRYFNLNLSQRIALRQGLRQMHALEESRRPLAFTSTTPLFEMTLKWECKNLRFQADYAKWSRDMARVRGVDS